MNIVLNKQFKSPNIELNIPRIDDFVDIDKILSNNPAVDSDVSTAQIFIDYDTMVSDVYPMKTGKHLSTHLSKISGIGVPLSIFLVTSPRLISVSRLRKSSVHSSLIIEKVNSTTNIRIFLSAISITSKQQQIK